MSLRNVMAALNHFRVRALGCEKAEREAAEFKAELENVTKQQWETEEHAKHLDGTLKVMQQLRGGREEHEKRLHDTIVKKSLEFDKLRLEMEAKLSGVSKSFSENRTLLIESQAENEALNHALQAMISIFIIRVQLEGLEKENFDLKYKIHSVTKELEYGKKTSDVSSQHYAKSVKKIVRLEDECNRLRVMVRMKLPRKEAGDSGRARRRHLIRSQSGGVDFLPVHELVQEDTSEAYHAQRIANMNEETRMLKEALATRNDELQQAHIMCAKTASRLTVCRMSLTLSDLQGLQSYHATMMHLPLRAP